MGSLTASKTLLLILMASMSLVIVSWSMYYPVKETFDSRRWHKPENWDSQNSAELPIEAVDSLHALPVEIWQKPITILFWTGYFGSKYLWRKMFAKLIKKKCPKFTSTSHMPRLSTRRWYIAGTSLGDILHEGDKTIQVPAHLADSKIPAQLQAQLVSSCNLTFDRSRFNETEAVVFHLYDMKKMKYQVPQHRPEGQLWIIATFESKFLALGDYGQKLDRLIPQLSHLEGHFNMTMSFRSDSDVVSRLGSVRALAPSEIPTYPDWGVKNWNTSAPVIWFISHCKTYSKREVYAKEMAKHIGVHIYGKCGPYKCGHSQRLRHSGDVLHGSCFDLVNANYTFILAFENAICKDYVTEKAYNAFQYVVTGLSITNTCPLCSTLQRVVRKKETRIVRNFTHWFMDESECHLPDERGLQHLWNNVAHDGDPLVASWIKGYSAGNSTIS